MAVTLDYPPVVKKKPAVRRQAMGRALAPLAVGAETKLVDWVAQSIAPMLSGLGRYATIVALVGAFYVLPYLFASITVHTATLLPVFLGIAARMPVVSPAAWALLLCYPLGLMGILTPYASGQCAVYYGSGYITRREYWLLGLTLGAIFFAIYMAIVIPWMMFLKI